MATEGSCKVEELTAEDNEDEVVTTTKGVCWALDIEGDGLGRKQEAIASKANRVERGRQYRSGGGSVEANISDGGPTEE